MGSSMELSVPLKGKAQVDSLELPVSDAHGARGMVSSSKRSSRSMQAVEPESEQRRDAKKARGCLRRAYDALVIIPEEVAWLTAWDLWIVAMLLATTYYEPYAVAVVRKDPFWAIWLNHVLDITFTIDMLLTFFIAYGEPLESAAETLWVKDPGRIAHRYLKWPLSDGGLAGYFWIDLATVLPGWWNLIQPHSEHMQYNNALVLLRLLRLVRITKLVRLQNLLFKWHQQYGFPFWVVEVGKLFFITSITSHWLACTWIVVEGQVVKGKLSYSTDKPTWLTALKAGKGDCCNPSYEEDEWCVYTIALYWATMTLTTVGYGDITAQNPMEYIACTISMLVVAYVWAYVVGKMVTLLESLDPQWQQFQTTMDMLQQLMDARNLPRELQVRLRRYMHESRGASAQMVQRRQLQEHVTQSLQREVAQCSGGIVSIFTKGVFWARDLEQDALLDLIRALEPCSFGPGEIMMLPQALLLMRKGIAAVKGRILNRGDIWGQCEILLLTEALIETSFPRTLSHVDILMLARSHLLEVCNNFPHADKRLRRAQVRTATFRAFIKTAKERKEAENSRKQHRSTRRTSLHAHHDAYAPSAATSFVSPGRSTLHMMSSLIKTEETSLSDLTLLLKGMNDKYDSVEETMKTILANQDTILARHLTS